MPETKFTPGPWDVYDENEGENPPRPFWCIANDAFHNGGEDDAAFHAAILVGSKEDAHLIAAAPDLYAALEQAIESLETCHACSDPCVNEAHDIRGCDCRSAYAWDNAHDALRKARGES